MGGKQSKQIEEFEQSNTQQQQQIVQLLPPYNKTQFIVNAYKPLQVEIAKYLALEKITIYFSDDEDNLKQNGSSFKYINRDLKNIYLYFENLKQSSNGFKFICSQFKDLPENINLMRVDLSCQLSKEERDISNNLAVMIKNLPIKLRQLFYNITKVNCSNKSVFKQFLDSLKSLPKGLFFLQLTAIDCKINEDQLMGFSQNLGLSFMNLPYLQELNMFFNDNIIRKDENKALLINFIRNIPDQILYMQIIFKVDSLTIQEILRIIQSLQYLNLNLIEFNLQIQSCDQKYADEQTKKIIQQSESYPLVQEFIKSCNYNNIENSKLQISNFGVAINNNIISCYWKGVEINWNNYLKDDVENLNLFLSTRFNYGFTSIKPLADAQKEKKSALLHSAAYNKYIFQPLFQANPGTQIKLNFWDLYI